MKAPADGWDHEEREAIEELHEELELRQGRHQHDPGIDVLRAGHHDALPPDLQRSVERRLADDPWARALLEGLNAAEPAFETSEQDRLLARIQRDATRDDVPVRRPAWFRPALAGAAVVAVSVAGWIVLRHSPQPPQVAPVPAEHTVASTPVPARPVFELPLEKPDVTLSLTALTWRGGADNAFLTDLRRALDAFREGDYAGADREFERLQSRYPDAVEVFFYGGVSRLFLNDAPRARAALARADELADATFAPSVAWYRAVAEQRTGHLAQARARLAELCRGSSERAAQACGAVKQIDATSGPPNAR